MASNKKLNSGYEIPIENSFSGCDMVATCTILGNTFTLGSVQTLSYSVHMERLPIRSLGNINAKDYVAGPRTIAGTLIFAVFDKHMLYYMQNKENGRLWKNYQSMTKSRHVLMDEIPPFDITITYANEYGAQARIAIYGVRLIDEGQVMSINDVYTENTYQYVATDIDYLNDDINGTIDLEESDEVEIDDNVPEPDIYTETPDGLTLSYKISTNNLIRFSIYKTVDGIPTDTSGIILINDLQFSQNVYTLSISNLKSVQTSLPLGTYTARYQEDGTGELSNIVDIKISEESESELTPPPVILSVVKTSEDTGVVTLYSENYNKGHDMLGYYNDISDLKYASLSGKGEAKLNIPGEIHVGLRYSFYTYSSADPNRKSAILTTVIDDIFNSEYISLYDFVNSSITDAACNAAFNFLLNGQKPENDISLAFLNSARTILEDSSPPFSMKTFDNIMNLVVAAENEYLLTTLNYSDDITLPQGLNMKYDNNALVYRYKKSTYELTTRKMKNIYRVPDVSGYLYLCRMVNLENNNISAPYFIYGRR